MLRVWIVLGLVLLAGVLLGIYLANRARRREIATRGGSHPGTRAASSARPTGPDDDAQFLRSINIDPDSLGEPDSDGSSPEPGPDKPTGSA